jgi:hypothetical protein
MVLRLQRVQNENVVLLNSDKFHETRNYVISLPPDDPYNTTALTIRLEPYSAEFELAGTLNSKNGGNLLIEGNGATIKITDSNSYTFYASPKDNSNKNLSSRDLTFDFQNIGKPIHIRGNDGSPASNIQFEDVRLLNARSVWGLQIGYDFPQNGLPQNQNSNIVLSRCEVTSSAGSGSLENVIISNARNIMIDSCIFTDIPPSTKPAALAIYGGCSDVLITNSTFVRNARGGLYVVQSDNVTVSNSSLQDGVKIHDSRNIKFVNNKMSWVRIFNLDSPTYDGHTAKYRGSRDISLINNTVKNDV